MSLDFSFADIKNYEAVCYRPANKNDIADGAAETDQFITALTEALIYATMGVGMNRITEKNVDAFFKRIAFYETVHGTWLRRATEPDADGKWTVEPRYITKEEVEQHIGLRTNASTFTDSQFANLMFRNFRRRR